MICVGIDAASFKHDVCIINEHGEILHQPFQIKNNQQDYNRLLKIIEDLKERLHDDQSRLGIESTGSYSETIVSFFSNKKGVDVIYINPLLTKMYQQTRKVHYAKTDKLDAMGIASFISSDPNIRTFQPIKPQIIRLKEIYREIVSSNKELCECKNRLRSTIHRYFPEYFTVFSDIFNLSSLWILNDIDTLERLGKKNAETYMKKVNKYSHGNISKVKCEKLIELSNCSIGVKDGYNAAVISSLVKRIQVILEGKETLLKCAEKLINETHPNLLTIPGVGIISAAGIIGEIGDINNFNSSDALYAFTGLDPKVYESGKYKACNVKISRKGSPYLRNALYIASECVIRFDPTFVQFYTKKMSEGKNFRNVLGHVAKKLCRVVYAMLKNNSVYLPQNC